MQSLSRSGLLEPASGLKRPLQVRLNPYLLAAANGQLFHTSQRISAGTWWSASTPGISAQSPGRKELLYRSESLASQDGDQRQGGDQRPPGSSSATGL